MKKLITISLLVLFTFNLGGYYFVFWGLKSQADKQLAKQLDDSDGNVDNAFEIRIPLTLPYPLQQTDFERKDGEFVYKNEHYRLVKQKLENDVLIIVCIKDQKSKHLTEVMDEFSKTSGESQPSGGVLFSGKVLQEYESSQLLAVTNPDGWIQNMVSPSSDHNLHSISLDFPSPPPKA